MLQSEIHSFSCQKFVLLHPQLRSQHTVIKDNESHIQESGTTKKQKMRLEYPLKNTSFPNFLKAHTIFPDDIFFKNFRVSISFYIWERISVSISVHQTKFTESMCVYNIGSAEPYVYHGKWDIKRWKAWSFE